jgi:RNA polymerase sigma factor (sigma-70 family)
VPIAEPRPARPRSLGARFRDDDATLVRRTQAGDERAFAAIFKCHHAPLLSYCRHMLGNREEGEDALQQAFIKAHQALLGGTAPRELRPWLYAIARNCCLSAIAARRATAPLQDHTPALAGLSDEVRQREDLRELLAAIGRLPEHQRSALLLAELDDLSHQAIATVLGCPVSKVKALVYQARSALIADRDARSTPCRDIREQLSTARGGELRRGPLRRHLSLCAGCRDFQLAVGAQRESLAAVLPVLPSAGLAAAILGHGTAHAATAASIGGVGGGAAPAGVAAGPSVGITTAGVTTTGGSGIATTGTAAVSTAVGAGTGGGTSVGALVGGGMITKLAVGGAVAALAAAGTVAVRQRPAKAIPSRVAHARLASFAAHRGAVADIAVAHDAPYGALAPASSPGLTGAAASPGPASPESLTGLTSSPPESPLTLMATSPPSLASTGIPGQTAPGQTAVKTGQSGGSEGSAAKARKAHAKLRRVALRRRARRLRKARRSTHLRKAHRKALRHRRHLAAPKPPKPPKPPAPAVAPGPLHTRHRKARPTPGLLSSPAASTPGSESNRTRGQHHPSAAGTKAGSTGAKNAGPETSTTGKGKGKGKASSGAGAERVGSTPGAAKSGSGTSTAKAGSTPGTAKAGAGAGTEKPSSHASSKETASGANTGKAGSEAGAGAGSTGRTGGATEASDSAPHTTETSGAGATSGKGGTSHPKKHLLEEGQLPNF